MIKFPLNKRLYHIFPFVFFTFILLGISQEYALGQTSGWSTPINFSRQPDSYSSASNIICDRYQNLHVFWGENLDQNGAPLSILFYKNDVGGTWSQPLDLFITTRFEHVHSAITTDNLIHLIWSDSDHQVIYSSAHLSSTT